MRFYNFNLSCLTSLSVKIGSTCLRTLKDVGRFGKPRDGIGTAFKRTVTVTEQKRYRRCIDSKLLEALSNID